MKIVPSALITLEVEINMYKSDDDGNEILWRSHASLGDLSIRNNCRLDHMELFIQEVFIIIVFTY